MHIQHRYGLVIVITSLITSSAQSQSSYSPTELDPPRLCASEQLSYHSNLFRLSDGVTDIEQILGPGASRSDTVAQTSACANADWQLAQQEVLVNLSIDDNRYRYNRMLNHTSGLGKVVWNWRTAGNWYGKIGGNYHHELSSFFNDRPLVKDLVDSSQYYGELNHDVGAFVKITVGGSRTDTSHSADERRLDNYRSTSGNAGITLLSLADNYVGANFTRTKATYPFDVMINAVPLNRDYHQDVESIRFGYAFAGKTMLHGSAGYLKREYPNASDGNFSGGVWRVQLNWSPSAKSRLDIDAWKELGAYFDLEAEHFVTRGISLAPSWTPRDKLKISVIASKAEQRYLTNDLTVPSTASRLDKVLIAGGEVTYRPMKYLDLLASYSLEQHDSNLQAYNYTDRVTALRVRARF